MSTPPPPVPEKPDWLYCAHGADPATDAVGCRGIHVPGHTACLAHLPNDADREAYLASLTPGASIDHRGTPFTDALLRSLLDALREPGTGVLPGTARFGAARFDSATFHGDAWFDYATFERDASFDSANFYGDARFDSATFKQEAVFSNATFHHDAWFPSVTFHGKATFDSAIFKRQAGFLQTTFEGDATFDSATFHGDAWFNSATFERDASFDSANFYGDVRFDSATFKLEAGFNATFERDASFDSANFYGDVRFDSAIFKRQAGFLQTTFEGDASFDSANFYGDVRFDSATFKLEAVFSNATFHHDAWFRFVTFNGDARFDSAIFRRRAGFLQTSFEGDATFDSATFQSVGQFRGTNFKLDASFVKATFERPATLGPLQCDGKMTFSWATFHAPANLWLDAGHLECQRTHWLSTADLRLRNATVDFAHAIFEYPLTIASEANPFVFPDGPPVAEQNPADAPDATVQVTSLRGVDAAHLVLADVDLSRCLFTGTVHLDQLQLDGTCSFGKVPPGTHWRRWYLVRFTQRRTLAEERHWRARQPAAVPGWNEAPDAEHEAPDAEHVGPAQLAPVYRALRKAFEDGKNEPGAADFYYGEMEMRRHDRTGTSRAERGLLHGYWLLSGYGLRASRALGWLAAAMLVTIMLLMGFGLPQESPKEKVTGTVPPGGGHVTFEIDKADPQTPTGNRFTSERFEKSLNVTLNSVVFRSSGQDLTTAGTYIERTSRLLEPVLLALAVLAIRGRVKR
ncbi:pentapeptide repeat-containing protein (plasmid) [Streptomyces sp. NBC_00868]|uniref:pentapeptide repeat-containing protein n=1 Tax=Streptomyces sp. NBC_00868 TaxID=2903683 RepID=UPI00386F5C20|nr:pentapeptide repeat-containing protein [Streptomyces sp. NBC_00868]